MKGSRDIMKVVGAAGADRLSERIFIDRFRDAAQSAADVQPLPQHPRRAAFAANVARIYFVEHACNKRA